MKALPKNIFVTGIDTNIGKTIISAILVQALQADYWKPVQSGNVDGTDTDRIRSLVSNPKSQFHTEAYNFKAPSVPAYAAEMEGAIVETQNLTSPQVHNRLIVEGAGGLMVHLAKNFMVIDLIQQLNMPVILVSKNYLGSINHTLLSIEAMRQREIEIAGIIYNSERNDHMRKLIFETSGVEEIGTVETAKEITKEFINGQSHKLLASLQKHFTIA
jgi:dethiobiotin synthetase